MPDITIQRVFRPSDRHSFAVNAAKELRDALVAECRTRQEDANGKANAATVAGSRIRFAGLAAGYGTVADLLGEIKIEMAVSDG